MQHTSMNWHLLNIPNHLEFVMAIALFASPVLHVTCYRMFYSSEFFGTTQNREEIYLSGIP